MLTASKQIDGDYCEEHVECYEGNGGRTDCEDND